MALARFLNWGAATYKRFACLTCGDDTDNFRKYHDATPYGVLACNVTTFTFDVGRDDPFDGVALAYGMGSAVE